jgi:hypothetical protein
MATTPQQEIRRFDIFAEWNRLKASKQLHLSAAESRAYGLALAKIVAARKFSGAQPSQVKEWKRRARTDDMAEPWWRHLGSDEEFRRKIVQRMGSDFYRMVFQPAILQAWGEGERYEDIRTRCGWPGTGLNRFAPPEGSNPSIAAEGTYSVISAKLRA